MRVVTIPLLRCARMRHSDMVVSESNSLGGTASEQGATPGAARRRSAIAGKLNTVMTFFLARLLPRAWAAKMFGNMMGSVISGELKDRKLGRQNRIAA